MLKIAANFKNFVVAVLVLVALGGIGWAGSASADVASLGDSYASGEGAGPFDDGTELVTGNGCHRSDNAWARLLGASEETHLACSGAVSLDFFQGQKPGTTVDAFSQLSRLHFLNADDSVSTVFVTIGGNDLKFADILADCVFKECLKNISKVEKPRLDELVGPLVKLAASGAKREAKGADVVLVGYPDIIPPANVRDRCLWLSHQEKVHAATLESELESTLASAAREAGVAYVSVRSALEEHELCTRHSWMFPVAGKQLAPQWINQQQGHPNARGQEAIADVVRQKLSSGAGPVPPPPAGCVPAGQIAAIIDDSQSMLDSDPYDLRRSGMELLIKKPSGQLRTLGAVEFGTEAGALFAPAVIGAQKDQMLASLDNIQGDGANGGDAGTNYNDAFSASTFVQPNAQARIFFTDGGHNEGEYLNRHQGGPRTYVVGLGIGPDDDYYEGDDEETADQRLRRIAYETGGHYFSLPGDNPTGRIQPVFNAIDALLQCRQVPSQASRKLTSRHRVSSPVGAAFNGADALEVVLSWSNPNIQVKLGSAVARNAAGRVVASLSGRTARRHRGKSHRTRKVSRLRATRVAGSTFSTITVPRPKKGSKLGVTVKAPKIKGSTRVSVQIGPVPGTPVAPPTEPTTPTPPTPPVPTTYPEQETPNHPVNTFQNYHNASGMGPAIAAGQWVEVSCRVYDPTIGSVNPDGWWYRIASAPWNNAYYSPANTFMNGDPYGGPYTHNTDFNVPVC